VELNHLRIEGCLFTGKLVMVLSRPLLGIDLPGAGSCLLHLMVGLLLVGEELHSWLGCHCLHHDRRDGMEIWSALQDWCGDDGGRRDHHVAPVGAGVSQTPSGTGCGVILVGGLRKGRV
jgi:hypothetical protein